MSDTLLVPTPLYGLRTWSVVGESGTERLAGPHQRAIWPEGGAWLEATCTESEEHRPPSGTCGCGLHAWHVSPAAARRVLAVRRDIAGIVEARGAIEVHEDGFRAAEARPHVLFTGPGGNSLLAHRLAEAYSAHVVEVHDADAVVAFCRSRGLGLDEPTVEQLLGTERAEGYRRAKRRKTRVDALRLVAAVTVAALLVVAGLEIATDPPGERVLKGRAGEITVNQR